MSAQVASGEQSARIVAESSPRRVGDAALVAQRAAGPYRVLTIESPEVVAHAEPGQFVSIGVQAHLALLRRPFAIAGIDEARGTFDVVIAAVGQGSAWLTQCRPPDTLDVVGPLGRGFAQPTAPARCVLVGGGYGTAALEWLGECLGARGHTVELLSGAATGAALYPVSRFAASAGLIIETTEDGSRGRTGLVTTALDERLRRHPEAQVFACGPMPMLAAVADIASEAGCDCQVAVEEHMGCSVGVCMTCVVPTVEGYVRACIDGPVLDARRVVWTAVARRGAASTERPTRER